MQGVKAVRANEPEIGSERNRRSRSALKKERNIMKILQKLVLTTILFLTGFGAQAELVSGYLRSNGTYVAPYYRSDAGSYGSGGSSSSSYVYRNPYAAYPSVNVNGYYRSSGTYVAPYVRTAPNSTVSDNLS